VYLGEDYGGLGVRERTNMYWGFVKEPTIRYSLHNRNVYVGEDYGGLGVRERTNMYSLYVGRKFENVSRDSAVGV